MVQRQNFPLHAAAVLDVEEGISIGSENVAGADDVRAPKQNHAVAIGVRARLMINYDGLTVEMQVLGWRSIFVNRQPLLGKTGLHGSRSGQSVENVLLRDDL